jgi:hypothetical protein
MARDRIDHGSLGNGLRHRISGMFPCISVVRMTADAWDSTTVFPMQKASPDSHRKTCFRFRLER